MKNSLTISELYHSCDSTVFSFTTTKALETLEQPIGQENAINAINFASSIEQDGYNLFAMGPSGSGKHSSVMSFLEKKLLTKPLLKTGVMLTILKILENLLP